MQGSFEPRLDSIEEEEDQAGKRMRLDALTNVPWRNLSPANDKDTMDRMRRHYEMARTYEAMPNDKQIVSSKVAPYPETPDEVFPGTPCYKIMVGGETRLVFVLDPADRSYPSGWDGRIRAQTESRWVTPHFIWRDPERVEEAKRLYKEAYERALTRNTETPRKESFGTGVAGTDESYYVYGTDNTADAPAIIDPLFARPFNQRDVLKPNNGHAVNRPVKVKPWPYDQPEARFPRQPPPVQQERQALAGGPPAAAPPAAGPPAGAPAAPAPAAAGRRPRRAAAGGAGGAGPTGVHDSLRRVLEPIKTGQNGVDWITADPKNFEVSTAHLKDVCERAEELDYVFALSMQGLRGTNLNAVWMCTDPEYDLTDRASVLSQFVKMYMEKFYGQVSVSGPADVEEVVHEALRMYEEFCKGWIVRHQKTLSAEITAASEALVGLFYDDLKPYFPANLFVSRQQLSRFLRRHERYSAEFAHCLYHFMTSMEQSRGNRNPSYKAMSQEQSMYITAMKSMAALLHNNLNDLRATFRALDESRLIFDCPFIDWHHVAAQMPEHHKEFNGYSNSFNLYRSRTGARSNAFPPWQQMLR